MGYWWGAQHRPEDPAPSGLQGELCRTAELRMKLLSLFHHFFSQESHRA